MPGRLTCTLLVALAACSSPAHEPSRPREPTRSARTDEPARTARADEPAHAARERVAPLPPAELPAPPRLVAIGDVHGDVDALRDALRLGGAIDAADHWSGGALWVVQVGDLLDRGGEEDDILALLDRLDDEAEAAGGRLIVLNGNHELMNAQGDFRYVTPEGASDFAAYAREASPEIRREVPRPLRGRAAAFAPGGPFARVFASHPTVIRIGDSVFVHGGLSPRDAARGLARINEDVRAYLLAERPLDDALSGSDSPMWHRGYALDTDAETCAELARMLDSLHARRLVVGHTVQRSGITSACDERVWRIDVGLSDYYGGPTEVLAIEGERVSVLR